MPNKNKNDNINENIKKDLEKCTRCGLCISNCPIYDIIKDENNTSRGLILKLLGYEKKFLSEKELKGDLKICLNCSKCASNCPSKINTSLIFAYKNANFSPSKFSQRLLLILKLLPIKILYFLNFFKNLKKPSENSSEGPLKSNIYYFKGCVSKAQHKKTFLDKILYNPDFSCCALPYLTGGDIKNYEKAKEKNTKLIKEANLVVFDCATCKNTVSQYETLNEDDKKKLVLFDEILKDKKLKLKKNSKYFNRTITFHKPCHLNKNDFEKIENFIKNIEGINYKKLENADKCCGFGGSYFLFHPVISSGIAFKKAKDIKKTNADLILTICPSCVFGIRLFQLLSFNFKKTLDLRDFIEKETIS